MPRNQPTFAEIRSEVRRYLDDLNGGIWSDAEVNRNINRAILKVWADTEWEVKQTTFEGVVDNSWYLVPSDHLVTKALIATDWDNEKVFPTDLVAMDKHFADRFMIASSFSSASWEGQAAANPTRFLLFSYDKFLVWPPVNANSGNRTFAVEYTPTPATVSSDSSTTLGSSDSVPPLFISNLIPLKAAALSWLRQSWQKYMQFNQMYQERLGRVLSTLRTTSDTHTTKLRPAGIHEKAHGSPRFRLRL